MFTWNDDWLSKRTEAVVDPDQVIVDAHHHLWPANGAMQQYLLDDLHLDTSAGHRVTSTVFMECMWSYRPDGPVPLRPVGETEAVAAAAAVSAATGSTISGIVGFADMTLGDAVGDVLDAHVAVGDGLFRGIRHATALDADPLVRRTHTRPTPGLMAEPDFRAGVRQLGDRGLSFDAWLYHPQIRELTDLARAIPDVTFVLDHIGGPLGVGSFAGRREEILEVWRRDLGDLAACPNVVVKVGGIGMAVYGLGFELQDDPPSSDELVAAWGAPIRHVIDTFGVERCMFESNFPVDKGSCSYVVLWNAFKKMVADASPSEKDALFRGTASRIYRL